MAGAESWRGFKEAEYPPTEWVGAGDVTLRTAPDIVPGSTNPRYAPAIKWLHVRASGVGTLQLRRLSGAGAPANVGPAFPFTADRELVIGPFDRSSGLAGWPALGQTLGGTVAGVAASAIVSAVTGVA